MAKLLKLRRGTTSQHGSFTGAEGEVTIDTNKDTLVVHDNALAGGRPLLREDMSNLPAGTIDNADVNGSAAIAGTKISPDFGSQAVTTTGALTAGSVNTSGALGCNGELSVVSASPIINLTDTNANSDFQIKVDGGHFDIKDTTNNTGRLNIQSDGTTTISGNLNASSGVDVTGNVTATGAVDAAGMTISAATPTLNFNDSNDNPDFRFLVNSNAFILEDTTNSANRFVVNSDGHVDVIGNLDVGAGLDVTGSMTVTGTVDGRDVAADGTKLDGIESSATADQTAAEIRTLVESASDSNVFTDADHSKLNGIAASATNVTNNNQISNGAGYITSSGSCASATNADTVDSLHASQFVRSDTSDTMSGALEITGSLRVGHQANSSDIYMNDSDETTRRIHCNSSRIGFLTSANNWGCYADNSGNWTAVGNVTAYSDQKLKTNVNTINDALSIVGKLRGVSFDWKADGEHSIGLIAQEVKEVLPELVVTNKGISPVTQEIEEIKSVDYGKIVGVLINAINELKAELDAHKAEVAGHHGGK